MSNGTCSDEYWELINDYVDGRLTGKKLSKLRAHLRTCNDCSGVESEIRALRLVMSNADVQQPSDMFWERCLDNVISSIPERQPMLRSFWKPVTALVVAVSLLLVFLITRPHPTSVTPQFDSAVVESEVPHDELVMEYAVFLDEQPLVNTSHNMLVSARCAQPQASPGSFEVASLTADPEEKGSHK